MPSAQQGRIVSVERNKASVSFSDFRGFKTTASFDRSIESIPITDLRTRYKVGASVFLLKKTNPLEITFVCLESETITGEAEVIVVMQDHALAKYGNGNTVYIPMARLSDHRNYKKVNGNLTQLLVLNTKLWIRGVTNGKNDKSTWTSFKAIEVRIPPELMIPQPQLPLPTKTKTTGKKNTAFVSPMMAPPPPPPENRNVWNNHKETKQPFPSLEQDLQRDLFDIESAIELEMELEDIDFTTIRHPEEINGAPCGFDRSTECDQDRLLPSLRSNLVSAGCACKIFDKRDQGTQVDEKSDLQQLLRHFIEKEGLLAYVNRQYPRLFAKAYPM